MNFANLAGLCIEFLRNAQGDSAGLCIEFLRNAQGESAEQCNEFLRMRREILQGSAFNSYGMRREEVNVHFSRSGFNIIS